MSAILETPRSPRFHGGDYSLGFFILEDLGEHRSLVEPLLEEDAASAEKALLSFSACVGSVTELGQRVDPLQACLDGLGVRAGSHFPQEREAVIAAVENPGPFLSYIHGDPCPDNVFWNGEELRLIDFEFGGFGHAFLDGVYGRMPFPTCWCANSLPNGLVARMEAV